MLSQVRIVILAFCLANAHQSVSAVGQQLDVTHVAERREPKSWEISKRYGDSWLHKQFLLHERLPEKITVPAVEATVVDADGAPVAGAEVVSHTPRHWVRIMPDMTLHPQPHGSATKTSAEGKFTLPERTEPYRVLVLHDSGVADITHETLLYAKGRITLQQWSRIEGTAILGGKPLANTRILVRPDYSGWSYSTGGPRVTGDIFVDTDGEGRFTVDKVPAIAGRTFLMRPLTEFHRKKSSGPLSHATQYVCQPGKLTRLEMGIGKTVTGSLSPMDLGPEDWIDWKDAFVWLRHNDSTKPKPVDLPQEIVDLDETARDEWEWNWQLTTPEGRVYSAKQFFLMNQNYYAAVTHDGEFQIDGVPEGTYDLAVRGFCPLGEEQPRSTYYSKNPITVKAPLDKPLGLGGWDMVDAETWYKSLARSTPNQETARSKVAIHRVVGHKNALPFGRGGNDAEPRRIRFGTMSPQDTRFDAMRPESYPFDGLEYNPTRLISIDDITAYDWRKHEIHLTEDALDRLRRNIKPSVWGVPFVVVVDGKPVYLGAFWTGASSYSANMPTICLDSWVVQPRESNEGHLRQNIVRIENSQILEEGEKPADHRANAELRRALDEAGKLINEPSAAETEE